MVYVPGPPAKYFSLKSPVNVGAPPEIAKLLSAMVPAKVTLVRLGQSQKASASSVVTLAGMVTLVRPQYRNELIPIERTDEGMVTLVRLVQARN